MITEEEEFHKNNNFFYLSHPTAGGGVGDLLGDEDDWSQGDCPLLPRHHHGPAFPAVTQLADITPPGSSAPAY